MKMKKLLATLMAGAVAVSSMSVAAFALAPGRSGEPVTLWEGSAKQGTDWGWNPATVAAADFASVEAGETITIDFTIDGEAEYHQIKIVDGASPNNVLTSPEGVNEQYGTIEATGTSFTFTINADDLALIKATGLNVCGFDVTLTAITLNKPNGGETPDDTTPAPSVPSTTPSDGGNDPFGGNVPTIRPVAPSGDTSTEAPADVVTGANGESVEAPADVVPAGATLEVKEESKEDAVKAVEAVKATDANKEVVETIKKAIEDDKAAVVEIDLVKDGAKVQPNGTIKVTINVPAALKDAAKVFVYRVEEDGTFTDVKATVSGGKIVFSTTHFSTYIITSEALSGDAVVTEAPAATDAPSTPAQTDDKNQGTGVVLAIIPAAIAAAGVVISKKRK